nr:peroxiredoxin-like family protein [Desulfococcus multivorans]
MKVKPVLDQLTIGLVAIGSGSPDSARRFVQEFQFDGDMVVDPTLEAYRAFKLKRGLLETLGPTALLKGLGAMKKGFRQGSTDGDLWQQGGLFVIGPGEEITFAHRDRFAGDHADLDQVIASLKS